ncbi:CASC4 protein, partial [Atractosteus spatula]|nr:CASC4 protein [Atractosteus spatula]
MVGFGANRRGGRLPSFILIALLVIILVLSFNYWTVSSKHTRLLDELAEVQAQVKRTDAARSRLEKRNSELIVQVDTHRKQIDQKDGDYITLESKLQALEAQAKKCADEKVLSCEVPAEEQRVLRVLTVESRHASYPGGADEPQCTDLAVIWESGRPCVPSGTVKGQGSWGLQVPLAPGGTEVADLCGADFLVFRLLPLWKPSPCSQLAGTEASGSTAPPQTRSSTKLQSDQSTQRSEIQRLQEQLEELRQEFMKLEDQLHETKKNSTFLEKKLEYESLQCGQQIAELKSEYEEKMKRAVGDAEDIQRKINHAASTHSLKEDRAGPAGSDTEHTDGLHTEATHKLDSGEQKGVVKHGSDAGMPGIEDSEVGKAEDVHFALKKPAITLMKPEAGGAEVARERAAGGREGAQGEPRGLDAPKVGAEPGNADQQQQVAPQPAADNPRVFEDGKAGLKADELGERRRQMRAPINDKPDHRAAKDVGLQLPPNPVQVLPQPNEHQAGQDPQPADPPQHRQSRFFDENESPVDPQHGSKLADYNGDDGNVGEYEADKQAELAYNEEEDGDGGEEDVQDDEDRELQGDRAIDYGKRHQANDIL